MYFSGHFKGSIKGSSKGNFKKHYKNIHKEKEESESCQGLAFLEKEIEMKVCSEGSQYNIGPLPACTEPGQGRREVSLYLTIIS